MRLPAPVATRLASAAAREGLVDHPGSGVQRRRDVRAPPAPAVHGGARGAARRGRHARRARPAPRRRGRAHRRSRACRPSDARLARHPDRRRPAGGRRLDPGARGRGQRRGRPRLPRVRLQDPRGDEQGHRRVPRAHRPRRSGSTCSPSRRRRPTRRSSRRSAPGSAPAPARRARTTTASREKVELLLAEPVPVVSFTFGCPEAALVERFRAAGSEVWVTVTDVAEARAAHAAGADALVVQGYEAGGHRGGFADDAPGDVGLLALLQLVGAALPGLPLVATGGIATGRAVAAVLAAGAAAAQVGTALMRAPEAATAPVHRDALAQPGRTAVTRAFTGRSARGHRQHLPARARRGRAARLSRGPPHHRAAARPRARAGRCRDAAPVGRPGARADRRPARGRARAASCTRTRRPRRPRPRPGSARSQTEPPLRRTGERPRVPRSRHAQAPHARRHFPGTRRVPGAAREPARRHPRARPRRRRAAEPRGPHVRRDDLQPGVVPLPRFLRGRRRG